MTHHLGNEMLSTKRVVVPLNNLITLIMAAQVCGCDPCVHAIDRIAALSTDIYGEVVPQLSAI